MSRRHRTASRSKKTRDEDPGLLIGLDGKIETTCPDCGARFRVAAEMLEDKLECTDCHRVFFVKSTAGKRLKPPDHSKTYMLFGLCSLGLIGLFWAMSNQTKKSPSGETPATTTAPPKAKAHDRGSHPRAKDLHNWGNAMGSDNRLVLKTYTDVTAIGRSIGAVDPRKHDAVLHKLATDESTKLFREMVVDRVMLTTDEAMINPTGRATLYLHGKPGINENTEAEVEVAFLMDEQQLKVTAWMVTKKPVRLSTKPG